jgi:hypothetical protein
MRHAASATTPSKSSKYPLKYGGKAQPVVFMMNLHLKPEPPTVKKRILFYSNR